MDESLLTDLITQEHNVICSLERLSQTEKKLGCVDGKIIGTGRSDYTQESTIYNLSIGGKTFGLIDIPGIEGDESRFEDIIKDSLNKAHIIFYINGSGKKIEKATLEKIKKYMRDGTSVYALFNVHCKAQKERLPGFDKTYAEDLADAYERQDEIIKQTESELRSFLGQNYIGSISLNGLLSFCGLAIDERGNSTIVADDDKNLCTDQQKYLHEYDGHADDLVKDGRIANVQNVITEKLMHIEADIYDENLRKLRNRLQSMHEQVYRFCNEEIRKMQKFKLQYDKYESDCKVAKEEYIGSVKQIGRTVVNDTLESVKERLFEKIENENGKWKLNAMETFLESKKDEIAENLTRGINEALEKAKNDYEENIQEAQRRLLKDLDRQETIFKINLSANDLSLTTKIHEESKVDWKSVGDKALNISGWALTGVTIGTTIPVLGSIVGGAIGVLVGAIFSTFKAILVSKEKRMNEAKKKISNEIDEQAGSIIKCVTEKINDLDYENMIEEHCEQLCNQAEKQKRALKKVITILRRVSYSLDRYSQAI